MAIEFSCTSCNKLLRVPDGSNGRKCQCPVCGVLLEVPNSPRIALRLERKASRLESRQPVTMTCPKCRQTLLCEKNLIGTKGQCKNCKTIFVISDDPARSLATAAAEQFVFSCPNCSQLFEGKPEMNGRKGKCHTCDQVFTIEFHQFPKQQTRQAPPVGSDDQATSHSQAGTNGSGHTNSHEPHAATSFQFACKACEGIMEVPGESLGQLAACPFCSVVQTIESRSPSTSGEHLSSSQASPTVEPATRPAGQPTLSQATLSHSTLEGQPSRSSVATPTTAGQSTLGPSSIVSQAPNGPAVSRSSAPTQRGNPAELPTQNRLAEPAPSRFEQQSSRTNNASALNRFSTSVADTGGNEAADDDESEAAWKDFGDFTQASLAPYAVTKVDSRFAAPRVTQRVGLSFKNAFQLTFESLFLNSLMAAVLFGAVALLSFVLIVAAGLVGGLLVSLLKLESRSMAETIVSVAPVAVVALALLVPVAGALAMTCNAALKTARGKLVDAQIFFSTAGSFKAALVIVATSAALGTLAQIFMPAFLQAGQLDGQETMAVGAIVAAGGFSLVQAFVMLALASMPFAMIDGQSLSQSFQTSRSIFFSNFLTIVVVNFCGGLLYLLVSILSCGLGLIALIGSMIYLNAAIYHLAPKPSLKS